MRFRSLSIVALLSLATTFVHGQEGLRAKKAADTIDIFQGSTLLTTFRFGDLAKPVFYPMKAPCGIPVTRAWPFDKGAPNETTDHPHQKSAWFCHGDIVAEGVTPSMKNKGIAGHDFWSEAKGHGKIVAVKVSEPKVVEGKVSFVVKNEWRSADDKKIFDETRTYHVIPLKGAWLVIMESDIFASVCKIIFEDTKEGSFGIRINDSITEKTGKGKLTNAEGLVGERNVWGLASNWCDYSGTIDGKTVGLTIFADPKNAHATCWHARGYGLMAANPFGRKGAGFSAMKGRSDLVTLNPGDHLNLRYGILVHDGDVEGGRVAENFKTFVDLRDKK